ncbi:MAG TPA: glucose-1-phosphate cytidylyltransferase [Candidatus Omnitrophota bacterium]|nr:glucose-1-phosphate cytidylyltransferase [Candidatus Omnitrophota bacterium]HPS21091.1 glucose-1-phosphate cytidylyltransferase [Candidatus Omnitrophota bacterium]
MKVVILCGGRGTRMGSDTTTIPKPMVDIGGKPILWHIMKIFSHYGFNEFVLCLGYRGYLIKEYFSHYFLHMSDVTIDMKNNKTQIHSTASEPWKITLVDTGVKTFTGGRIRRIRKYVEGEPFLLTYGDGLADINVKKLIKLHKDNKRLATVTGYQTAGRFGVLEIGNKNNVTSFLEKPIGEGSWINAGFFVLEPEIFDYIDESDDCVWENKPLGKIAREQQLSVYKHTGFWKCMDTIREKDEMEALWQGSNPPWKIW